MFYLLRPGNSRLPSVGVAWGVSREQVVSREELETERGWEESKEVLLPSLRRVRMITTTVIRIGINLKDDRWSEAETIEALREAGPVTFLDLQTGIVLGVNIWGCATWTAWGRQRGGRRRRTQPFSGWEYKV